MKALLIGATGLVGKEIIKLVQTDPKFTSLDLFARRSVGQTHSKLREHVVNFDDLDSWKRELKGDVLFSAMGTTLKAAGSKEAQYKVDFEYQYNVAKAARENGVRFLVLISSVGASSASRMFYLKTKGELEEAVLRLGFEGVSILRPSFLAGERKENRPGETFATLVLGNLPKIPALSRMLPVTGAQVASRALMAAGKPGKNFLGPRDILF